MPDQPGPGPVSGMSVLVCLCVCLCVCLQVSKVTSQNESPRPFCPCSSSSLSSSEFSIYFSGRPLCSGSRQCLSGLRWRSLPSKSSSLSSLSSHLPGFTIAFLLGPPVAMSATRPLCFTAVYFVFFSFIARSPRSLGRSPRNFATWSEMGAILRTRSKIWGCYPPNKWPKNMLFSVQFRTTSHFDCEYLRNGTRYRQSENSVASYDLSRVC